jgi:hypothetical protein
MTDEEQQLVMDEDYEKTRLVSRRAFLSGTLAGGAAGIVAAAGTGLGVYKVFDARSQEALAAAESEVERLRGLVELYEKIEKVGLDGILQTGMAAVAVPLEVVQQGAELLKKGLEVIEAGVVAFREALPSTKEAFAWVKSQIETLADAIERLDSAMETVVDRATDNRVATTLGNALHWVLDRLPFHWGEKIRDAFDRVVTLIGQTDDLVRDVNSRLLEPVEQRWFPNDESGGLGPALLDPLVGRVLDPLEEHLGKLAALVDAWQATLVAPAQKAMGERRQIREEIALYRENHGMPR